MAPLIVGDGALMLGNALSSLLRSLRLAVRADARSEQARQGLLNYVSRRAETITAVDRLRDGAAPTTC